MATVEILRAKTTSGSAEAILQAFAAAARLAGDRVFETDHFHGKSDWLVLFGVGAAVNHSARKKQIANGGRVLHWDHGYVQRKKVVGHMRMCIDVDHPHAWIEKTPPNSERWAGYEIPLREDASPTGPVLLIGLGQKSRDYLHEENWEFNALKRLSRMFPERRIIFRPKGNDKLRLPCGRDADTPIEDLLRGASLAYCRHSNVAVDATIAGVPFECIDGAALWLKKREFTPENRLEFLQRLAMWQWRPTEAAQAWAFAKEISCA